MSMTESDILTRVNQITKREETSISDELAETLNELSIRTYAYKSEVSGTLSSGSNSFAVPTDFIDVQTLNFDTNNVLDRISFSEFKQGYIPGYAVHNGYIYISPTPGSDRTYTLYYFAYHPVVTSAINFADKYKNAIIYGVAQRVYDNYELYDEGTRMAQKFEIELVKYPPDNIFICKPRSMRA